MGFLVDFKFFSERKFKQIIAIDVEIMIGSKSPKSKKEEIINEYKLFQAFGIL
jgi:hypothetical protein